MHPILSDRRKLFSYIGAWLVIGALLAQLLVLGELADWRVALAFGLPVALVFGFMAGSAYYVSRSLPASGRRMLPTISVFMAATLVAGTIWLELCIGWNRMAGAFGWWHIGFTHSSYSLLFFAGCASYLVSLLIHDLLIAAERVRNAELRAAQSQLNAREAELQMLRTQINPHFLFNSLNSISALTSIDSGAARAMTIALAQFFRQSLALSMQNSIPLATELALCQAFLEVERNRFGSKLRQQLEISSVAENAEVPPMLLQPLVENAIKHGISVLPGGGEIRIKAQVREKWLQLSVSNPYDARAVPVSGEAIGLQNSRNRLANIYGNQSNIQWKADGEQFTVEITLPLRASHERTDR